MRLTRFLDVSAVFGGVGIRAEAHQVDGKHPEYILVPHDEVGHHTVGSPVLLKDCVPLLHGKHTEMVQAQKISSGQVVGALTYTVHTFSVLNQVIGLDQTCKHLIYNTFCIYSEDLTLLTPTPDWPTTL